MNVRSNQLIPPGLYERRETAYRQKAALQSVDQIGVSHEGHIIKNVSGLRHIMTY